MPDRFEAYNPDDLGWIDARIAARKKWHKNAAKKRNRKKSHRIVRGSRRW